MLQYSFLPFSPLAHVELEREGGVKHAILMCIISEDEALEDVFISFCFSSCP
jgi:hypothetical protein